jgi:hypothetical protein
MVVPASKYASKLKFSKTVCGPNNRDQIIITITNISQDFIRIETTDFLFKYTFISSDPSTKTSSPDNIEISNEEVFTHIKPVATPSKPLIDVTITTPIIKSIIDLSKSLAEPVDEPLAEPVVTPVAEPVVTPVAEPVVTPVAEPVVTPVAEPVVTPVAEPVVTPVAEPVVTPVAEPVVTPATITSGKKKAVVRKVKKIKRVLI